MLKTLISDLLDWEDTLSVDILIWNENIDYEEQHKNRSK